MIGTTQEFDVALTRHEQAFTRNVDLLVQGFCHTTFTEIQSGGRYSPGTPVDEGTARAAWQGGLGGTLEEAAVGAKAGDVVDAVNPMPYLPRLEFGFVGMDAAGRTYSGEGPKSTNGGHSTQAPQGFIRLALMHGQDILNEVAAHVPLMA